MLISLIVAMDDNGTIGADGGLPWRLPADLKHFKAVTMGKPIIMGRKTFESIGRSLPGRENIVLTRDPDYKAKDCTVLHSLDDLFIYCRYHDEIVIMGGAELYRQFLDKADLIYLTEVHTRVASGDTWFPEYNPDIWNEVAREDFRADEKNEYDYSFVVLKRETGVE